MRRKQREREREVRSSLTDTKHPVSSQCSVICGHRAPSGEPYRRPRGSASDARRRTDKSTDSGHFSSSVALRASPLRNGDADDAAAAEAAAAVNAVVAIAADAAAL